MYMYVYIRACLCVSLGFKKVMFVRLFYMIVYMSVYIHFHESVLYTFLSSAQEFVYVVLYLHTHVF
jgi:hypothetical protein